MTAARLLGHSAAAGVLRVPAALPVLRRRGPAPRAFAACRGNELELVLAVLASRRRGARRRWSSADNFQLHCVPAINLFPKRLDRIQLDEGVCEFHVVPDRTRPLDFEVLRRHRRRPATATASERAGASCRCTPPSTASPSARQRPTTRPAREPRLLSDAAAREGPRSGYVGTEVFLSLVDPREAPYRERAAPARGADALHQPRPAAVHAAGAAAGASCTLDVGGAGRSRCACVPGLSRPLTRAARGRVALAAARPPVAELPVAARQPTQARRRGAARDAGAVRRQAPTSAVQRQVEGVRSVRAQAGGAAPAGGRADRVRPRARGRARGRRTRLPGRQRLPVRRGAAPASSRATSSINSFVETVLRRSRAARSCAGAAAVRRERAVAVNAPAELPRSAARSDAACRARCSRALPSACGATTSSRCCAASKPRTRSAAPRRRALRPSDEPVRLGQEPALIFAPAALHALRAPTGAGRRACAQRFFGLLGPERPAADAPDRVRARARCTTTATRRCRASSTCFTHRFCAAASTAPGRRRSRRSASTGRDDDRFVAGSARCSASARATRHERDALGDDAKLYFAGRLARQVRDADGLRGLVPQLLRRAGARRALCGHWMPLAATSARASAARARPARARPRRACSAASRLGRAAQVPHRHRPAAPERYRALPARRRAARAAAGAGAPVRRPRVRLGPAADPAARRGAALDAAARRDRRVGGSAAPPGSAELSPAARRRRPDHRTSSASGARRI